jgi:hypothetical protein
MRAYEIKNVSRHNSPKTFNSYQSPKFHYPISCVSERQRERERECVCACTCVPMCNVLSTYKRNYFYSIPWPLLNSSSIRRLRSWTLIPYVETSQHTSWILLKYHIINSPSLSVDSKLLIFRNSMLPYNRTAKNVLYKLLHTQVEQATTCLDTVWIQRLHVIINPMVYTLCWENYCYSSNPEIPC